MTREWFRPHALGIRALDLDSDAIEGFMHLLGGDSGLKLTSRFTSNPHEQQAEEPVIAAVNGDGEIADDCANHYFRPP